MIRNLLVAPFVILMPFCSLAAAGLTLQGRITLPSGAPLAEDNVLIKTQILTPDSNECLLFEEISPTNLSATEGLFSIVLNQNGTRTDGRSWSFANSLSNSGSFSFTASSQCATGSGSINYTPTSSDERKIALYFKRQNMADWEEMTDPNNRPMLTHSAYSQEARRVTGFGIESLCRVADAGSPQSVAALSSANFAELLNLINGSSTQYVISSSTSGADLPAFAGNPASSSEGAIWYDSANKRIMFNDGTGTPKSVGSSSSSVTSGGQTGSLSVGTTDSNSLSFLTNNISRMTIANDGKVGVGTASPLSPLHLAGEVFSLSTPYDAKLLVTGNENNYATSYIQGDSTSTTAAAGAWQFIQLRNMSATATGFGPSLLLQGFRWDGTNNVQNVAGDTLGQITFRGSTPGSFQNTANISVTTPTGSDARMNFQIKNNSGAMSGLSSSTKMVIESSGNVGIGTTSPSTNLTVSSANHNGLDISADTSNAGYSGRLYLSNNTAGQSLALLNNAGKLEFRTGATPGTNSGTLRMTMDTAGNLGVGTSSPSAKLEVAGNMLLSSTSPFIGMANSADRMRFGMFSGGGSIQGSYFQLFGNTWSTASQQGGAEFVFDTRNSGTGGFSVLSYDGSNWANHFKVATSGNVGIGTASPTSTLEVGGTVQLKGSQSSTGLYVNSAGNVGIGTTSPSSVLHIQGSGSMFRGDFIANNNVGADFSGRKARGTTATPTGVLSGDRLSGLYGIGYTSDAGWSSVNTAAIQMFAAEDFTSTNQGTKITFETTPIGSTTRSTAMTVLGSGNVGIGTTSPANNLQIGTQTSTSTATPVTLSLGGTYSSTAGANPKLKLWDNGVSSYGIGVSANQMDFMAPGGSGFGFYPHASATAALSINSSSRVGIGMNSTLDRLNIAGGNGGTGLASFWSDGTTNTTRAIFRHGGNNGGLNSLGGVQIAAQGTNNATNGSSNIHFLTAANGTDAVTDGAYTARMSILGNTGNVGIGTSNPQAKLHVSGNLRVDTLNAATATQLCIDGNNVLSACSSSIRYKENVLDLEPSLGVILNLRPVSYDWKKSKEHDVGFIAEEVEQVDSRLVTYNKEGQIQGVKYDQLASPIIKAIQELYHSIIGTQAEIEVLKAENAKLRAEAAKQQLDHDAKIKALEQKFEHLEKMLTSK